MPSPRSPAAQLRPRCRTASDRRPHPVDLRLPSACGCSSPPCASAEEHGAASLLTVPPFVWPFHKAVQNERPRRRRSRTRRSRVVDVVVVGVAVRIALRDAANEGVARHDWVAHMLSILADVKLPPHVSISVPMLR